MDLNEKPFASTPYAIPMVTNKLKLLANAMQAYTMRAQTTTSNLANIETPGYRRERWLLVDSTALP